MLVREAITLEELDQSDHHQGPAVGSRGEVNYSNNDILAGSCCKPSGSEKEREERLWEQDLSQISKMTELKSSSRDD